MSSAKSAPQSAKDVVSDILEEVDIPTLAIKMGALSAEKIMKHIVKAILEKIQARWNRQSESAQHDLDMDILVFLQEKEIPGKNLAEFLQLNKIMKAKPAACMGNSNTQRPDGVYQFTSNNEVCHLFVEIDANDKSKQREHEAYKIWSDISASVAGQSSNTSPGESKSCCILRINSHSIKCSQMHFAASNGRQTSIEDVKSNSVLSEAEQEKFEKEYRTSNIDELKHIFIMMHKALAKQIIRTIVAWLNCVYDKGLLETQLTPKLSRITKDQRVDFCFWVGQYEVFNPFIDTIETLTPTDHKKRSGISKNDFIDETENAKGNWTKAIYPNNVAGFDLKWSLEQCVTEDWAGRRTVDLNEIEKIADLFFSFEKNNNGWIQNNLKSIPISNTMRCQGHFIHQLEAMHEIIRYRARSRIQDEQQNLWLERQEPFMHVQTKITTNRGQFNEITKVHFIGANQKDCEFTVEVGLVSVCIPRANVAELDFQVKQYLKPIAEEDVDNVDMNKPHPETFPDTPGDWDDSIKQLRKQYDQTIGKVKGMWYASHIKLICTHILQSGNPKVRERHAHYLFINASHYDIDERPQRNREAPRNLLPLAEIWTGEGMEWDTTIIKNSKASILVPVLWEPLSSMLINAFLFYIRGIQSGSPGQKHFATSRAYVRNTDKLYKTIGNLISKGTIMPDLLAGAQDRISDKSVNLNTWLLWDASRTGKTELSAELRDYLHIFNSQHCVAFCHLVKCTDLTMLHWMAKMYYKEQYKPEIDRHIRMFPLAAQALILRMLYETANDNPIVWKSNVKVKQITTKIKDDTKPDEDDTNKLPFPSLIRTLHHAALYESSLIFSYRNGKNEDNRELIFSRQDYNDLATWSARDKNDETEHIILYLDEKKEKLLQPQPKRDNAEFVLKLTSNITKKKIQPRQFKVEVKRWTGSDTNKVKIGSWWVLPYTKDFEDQTIRQFDTIYIPGDGLCCWAACAYNLHLCLDKDTSWFDASHIATIFGSKNIRYQKDYIDHFELKDMAHQDILDLFQGKQGIDKEKRQQIIQFWRNEYSSWLQEILAALTHEDDQKELLQEFNNSFTTETKQKFKEFGVREANDAATFDEMVSEILPHETQGKSEKQRLRALIHDVINPNVNFWGGQNVIRWFAITFKMNIKVLCNYRRGPNFQELIEATCECDKSDNPRTYYMIQETRHYNVLTVKTNS